MFAIKPICGCGKPRKIFANSGRMAICHRQCACGTIIDHKAKRCKRCTVVCKPKPCERCGNEFKPREQGQRFCSYHCAAKYRGTLPSAGRGKRTSLNFLKKDGHHCKIWFKLCGICSIAFISRNAKQKCCGDGCKIEGRKPFKEFACTFCSIVFTARSNAKGAICGDACRAQRAAERKAKERLRYKISRRLKGRSLVTGGVNPYEVFTADDWRCCNCGVPTPRAKRGTNEPCSPELDHIVPLSRGGEHVRSNVQTLCRACNAAKSDHMPPAHQLARRSIKTSISALLGHAVLCGGN